MVTTSPFVDFDLDEAFLGGFAFGFISLVRAGSSLPIVDMRRFENVSYGHRKGRVFSTGLS